MSQPRANEQEHPKAGGGALLDFGPILVFFAAYKLGDIYWATGSFMVVAPLMLFFAWWRERRVRPLPLVTALIVLVFGGMTIWLHDPRFIYVKPTIVTALTGVILLAGLAFGRPLVKPLLGSALELTDAGWRVLSLRFGLFSLALAGANELVWRRFTPHAETVWVWFKLLGIPGLTLLFLLANASALERFRVQSDGE